jgi:hypothetical protein
MIDTSEPLSPGWWLNRLVGQLNERRERFDMLETYANGTNKIPAYADAAVRDAARRLMTMSHTNFAELAIEATRERMVPLGFRTGATSDDLGDREAWRIWQANALDADHKLIDYTTLALSQSYAIVGPVDPDIGVPLITPEDPREVIAECDPVKRRKVIAAAKVFYDDVTGYDLAYLYLPGAVLRAATEHREGSTADVTGWEWVDVQRLPIDDVPVVPFAYRPRIRGLPLGEIEPHLAILDRINYTVLNRLEIMTMQAFRQRAVKGVPTTDAQGNEVDYDELFRQGPGAVWTLPATAEMWESGALDLTPVLESVKADGRDFAAVTRTPLSYIFPDAAQGSAEGASLTREGLIFKAVDRIGQAGESYERMMQLAFLMAGDTARANRADLEVIWAPPERYTLTERGQAASQAVGLSRRFVQEKVWQLTPQEIARNEAELAAEAEAAALLEPVAVPAA